MTVHLRPKECSLLRWRSYEVSEAITARGTCRSTGAKVGEAAALESTCERAIRPFCSARGRLMGADPNPVQQVRLKPKHEVCEPMMDSQDQ